MVYFRTVYYVAYTIIIIILYYIVSTCLTLKDQGAH